MNITHVFAGVMSVEEAGAGDRGDNVSEMF